MLKWIAKLFGNGNGKSKAEEEFDYSDSETTGETTERVGKQFSKKSASADSQRVTSRMKLLNKDLEKALRKMGDPPEGGSACEDTTG